ncbi:MAG: hypothetical protein AAFU64_01315 [Bacteroidota bacterium]
MIQKISQRLAWLGFLAIISVFSTSHIGSPGIVFQGSAGPYEILASIRPPDVVPGTAQVSVRVKDKGISSVYLQTVYFRHGGDTAPPAEELQAIEGDEELYSGLTWLMAHGSSSVKIMVNGLQGEGSTVIPVPALATAQLEMDSNLEIVLLVLAFILFFGGITIVAASIGESLLKPGDKLSKRQKWKTGLVAVGSFAFFIWVMNMGIKWWNHEEGRYNRYMYKPVGISSELSQVNEKKYLKIHLEDQGHIDRRPGDLVPDHGKLMHVFMMSKENADHFAHVHPYKIDSVNYEVLLPEKLPAGDYRMFVDIVHESGLAETLVSELNIPSPVAKASMLSENKEVSLDKSDVDDSYYQQRTIKNNSQVLESGTKIIWDKAKNKKFKVGQIESLTFKVEDSNGLPAVLNPYMSMLGHLAILKEDAKVFIHLHPIGTISMAAQEALANTLNEKVTICLPLDSNSVALDSLRFSEGLLDQNKVSTMRDDILKMMEEKGLSNEVSFPYAFPEAGKYRMWVQVRTQNGVETAGFEVEVEE